MDPIIIQTDHPGYYYAICYIAAFLAAFVLLTFEGVRRKFSILPWWLIMATTFLSFMIGSQLIKWGPIEWQQALHYQKISAWPGRSVLGGILLFVPALLLAKHVLKFRYDVVDTFAFMFPAGLAIQRVGCLLAGCCHGTPSTLPGSIQYSKYSPAFHHQLQHGIISAETELPLPVHPVQVYDLLGCLGIIITLYLLRKRIKATGNFLATSLFLYGLIRFFLEFIRAGEHNSYFYMNTVQLAILMLLPLIACFIHWRETHIEPCLEEKPVKEFQPGYFGYGLCLLLLFFFVSRWLSVFEIISFNLILIPVLGLVALKAFEASTLPSLRVTTCILVILGIGMMGQTYPEYGKDSKTLEYWTAGFGVMTGRSNAYAGETFSSCGKSYSKNDANEFSARGLGVSHVRQINKNESRILGLNGFWGNNNHDYYSTTAPLYSEHNAMWGINPYYQYNWENFGLGIGFTAGQLAQVTFEDKVNPSHTRNLSIYPSFSFRAGKLQEMFFEYRFANQFPTPFPALTHQLSVGVGMGKHGGVLRMGTGSNAGFIISPSFTFGNHLIIEPFFSTGGGIFNNSGADDRSSNMVMINMHFKLGRQENP